MKRTVFIVDDHPVCRAGLRALINTEPVLEVIGEAAGASQSLCFLRDHTPDIVVLDLSLKEGSGMQIIKFIRSYLPDTKILVASMHNEYIYAERVLRQGANGYINKEQAAENILHAIMHVLSGKIYLSEEVSDYILHRRMTNSFAENEMHPTANLSNRELEVFTKIGAGLSSKNIAEQLHVSIKTVDSHRENIKRKLGLLDGSTLVQRAVAWVVSDGL